MADTSTKSFDPSFMHGGSRTRSCFWKEFSFLYGSAFSEKNMRRILDEDFVSPIVDEQWITFSPEDQPFLGQKLVHTYPETKSELAFPIPYIANGRTAQFGVVKEFFESIKNLIPNYDSFFPDRLK